MESRNSVIFYCSVLTSEPLRMESYFFYSSYSFCNDFHLRTSLRTPTACFRHWQKLECVCVAVSLLNANAEVTRSTYDSLLIKRSNLTQQYADIYLLQSHSICFRASQHPSSGVIKTVTATSGIGHNTGTATSFQRGRLRTPDDGCCDARNM